MRETHPSTLHHSPPVTPTWEKLREVSFHSIFHRGSKLKGQFLRWVRPLRPSTRARTTASSHSRTTLSLFNAVCVTQGVAPDLDAFTSMAMRFRHFKAFSHREPNGQSQRQHFHCVNAENLTPSENKYWPDFVCNRSRTTPVPQHCSHKSSHT